jgi:hypothetical protein
MTCRSAAGGLHLRKTGPHVRDHRRVRNNCLGRSVIWHGGECASGSNIGVDQKAYLFPVVTRHHNILRNRGETLHAGKPHACDVDEGAAHQFEVLDYAAVEQEAFVRPRRIEPAHGVADQIEAVLIERFCCQVWALPVARHHVRPAHPDFMLVAVFDQLQLDTRNRHADDTRAFGLEVTVGGERRGLGRAPGRDHHDRLADRLARQVIRSSHRFCGSAAPA